jgi:outer membrane protein assembly factor BamB
VTAADWPTFGHDPQRSGWATEETTLTPQNVSGLQLLWKTQVKNEPKSLTALTAPVIADAVSTAQGVKQVIYVAGSADHMYALDSATGNILWSHDFEVHSLPKDEGMWLCPNNLNDTPVIDRRTSNIYVIASDGRLWGLDLGSGDVKFGPVQFVAPYSKNWSLNLSGTTIYTAISQGCGGTQSGIYSIDIGKPRQPVIHMVQFSHLNGPSGVWGRGGPVIGGNGYIYVATGDGDFNPAIGNYGSSFVQVSLKDLHVAGYFAPRDYHHVTQYDLDIASSSPVWFADGDHNIVTAGGKAGVVYMLDADSPGGKDHHTSLYTARLCNDKEEFQGKGIWGSPSAWQDEAGQTWVYFCLYGPVSSKAPKPPIENGPNPHGSIMAFKVVPDAATKKPTLSPAWVSDDLDLPDPPVIANGVLFAVSTGENPTQATGPTIIFSQENKIFSDTQRMANTHNAVLYAIDARTGKTLYRSGDAMGTWVHFSGIALADGRVYAVDHDSKVYCFGLKEKK